MDDLHRFRAVNQSEVSELLQPKILLMKTCGTSEFEHPLHFIELHQGLCPVERKFQPTTVFPSFDQCSLCQTKGIIVHHSGLLPTIKELVALLLQALIKSPFLSQKKVLNQCSCHFLSIVNVCLCLINRCFTFDLWEKCLEITKNILRK